MSSFCLTFPVSSAQETQPKPCASKLYPSSVPSGKSGSIFAQGAQNCSPGRQQCPDLVTALFIPVLIALHGGLLPCSSQLSKDPGNLLRVPIYWHVMAGNVYSFPLQR